MKPHGVRKEREDQAFTASPVLLSTLFLIAAGALAYSNSFNGPFIFDDTEIAGNLDIRTLWPPWQSMLSPLYVTRPLVGLSIAVNYAISGLDTWSYHFLNLLIHLGAGLALFGVTRRTLLMPALNERFGKRATGLALVIAMIWLVHPLQTQSVTYIIQRGESLMGLCYLVTLYCAIRSFESSSKWWTAGAIVTCLAGMMSKQVMATAPLMILLYDLVFQSASIKEAIKRRWQLYAGLAATWGVLVATVLTAPQMQTAGFGINKITPFSYFISQPQVIAHYLRLAFWPDSLVLDYQWPVATSAARIMPYAIVIGTLCILTVFALIRKRPVGLLGAWFFGILAVTSSFLPIADLANEHRMYLSLASVVCLVVLSFYRLGGPVISRLTGEAEDSRISRLIAISSVAVVVAGLSFLTLRRNLDYQSPLVMWQDVVMKRPENSRAHTNVGKALAELDRIDEALNHFEAACKYDVNSPSAHSNLGQALISLGRVEEGKRELELALKIKPDYPYPHYNLGKVLAAEGRTDEAIGHFLAAIEADPGHAEAYYNLALSYEKENRLADAIDSYKQAVRFEPDWPEAMSRLAIALAASPGATQQDALQASALARRSVELTGEQNPLALHALAESYARQGRPDDASVIDKRALELARASGDSQLVATIEVGLQSGTRTKPAE